MTQLACEGGGEYEKVGWGRGFNSSPVVWRGFVRGASFCGLTLSDFD